MTLTLIDWLIDRLINGLIDLYRNDNQSLHPSFSSSAIFIYVEFFSASHSHCSISYCIADPKVRGHLVFHATHSEVEFANFSWSQTEMHALL